MADMDANREWIKLAEIYAQKYDDELLDLAEEFDELTSIAQQVLQAELKSRNLSLPQTAVEASPVPKIEKADLEQYQLMGREGVTPRIPVRGYATEAEARAAGYLLERAKIQNWVESAETVRMQSQLPRISTLYRHEVFGAEWIAYLLVVSMDDVDKISKVVPDVLPPELVEEMKQDVGEFVAPRCPECGSDQVMLDPSVTAEENVNHWLCDACEHQWQEKLDSSF